VLGDYTDARLAAMSSPSAEPGSHRDIAQGVSISGLVAADQKTRVQTQLIDSNCLSQDEAEQAEQAEQRGSEDGKLTLIHSVIDARTLERVSFRQLP
jgi:hypothetical protein